MPLQRPGLSDKDHLVSHEDTNAQSKAVDSEAANTDMNESEHTTSNNQMSTLQKEDQIGPSTTLTNASNFAIL